jgi:hypothetical protein
MPHAFFGWLKHTSTHDQMSPSSRTARAVKSRSKPPSPSSKPRYASSMGTARHWVMKGETVVLRLAGTLAYLAWAIALGTCSTNSIESITGSLEPKCIDKKFMSNAIRLWREFFWSQARQQGREPEARGLLRRDLLDRRVGHRLRDVAQVDRQGDPASLFHCRILRRRRGAKRIIENRDPVKIRRIR